MAESLGTVPIRTNGVHTDRRMSALISKGHEVLAAPAQGLSRGKGRETLHSASPALRTHLIKQLFGEHTIGQMALFLLPEP